MKVSQLTYKDFLFFTEMFIFSGIVRACILLFPIRKLGFLLGKLSDNQEEKRKPSKETIVFFTRSINRVSKYAPWKVNCMVRSITLKFFLKRQGYDVYLNLGLTKPSGHFKAHAWISFESKKTEVEFERIVCYN